MAIKQVGSRLALAALLNTVHISLHTADPTAGNEVTGNGYARRPMAFAELASSNPTTFQNSAIVEFAVATGNWGNITHFAIWDAATAGNMRYSGAVTTPKTITTDDVVRWIAGALKITMQ